MSPPAVRESKKIRGSTIQPISQTVSKAGESIVGSQEGEGGVRVNESTLTMKMNNLKNAIKRASPTA